MANYLYNGIELPALPEWDKNTYPYAIIVKIAPLGDASEFTRLYVSTNTLYIESDGDFAVSELPTNYLVADVFDGGDNWGEFESMVVQEIPDIAPSLSNFTIIWSNHDLPYENSTEIYLSASVPIPANGYEAHLHNGTWRKGTFYKRVNNAWVKHQAYRRQNGAWVKVKE